MIDFLKISNIEDIQNGDGVVIGNLGVPELMVLLIYGFIIWFIIKIIIKLIRK